MDIRIIIITVMVLICAAVDTVDIEITEEYLDLRYKELRATAEEMLLEFDSLNRHIRSSDRFAAGVALYRRKRQSGTGSSGSSQGRPTIPNWWDQVGGWVDKGLDTFGDWLKLDDKGKERIKAGVDIVVKIGDYFMSRQQAKEAAERWEADQLIKIEELCGAICVTEWSSWSLCSQRCGGGTSTRTRSNVLPGQCKSLQNFVCRHRTTETKSCNTGCANGGHPKQGGGCNCPLGFVGMCCSSGVKCGYPGRPRSGKVELSGSETSFPVSYGTVASFSCNTGYDTEDPTETVCEVKNNQGAWSTPVPTCERITCRDPGQPANGRLLNIQSTYVLGDEAVFLCNDGFKMWGPQKRQCAKLEGITGRWTGFMPLCSPMKCPMPDTPNYSQRNGTNFNVGGRITYSCARGFQLHGSKTRVCMPTGRWSGNAPECKVVSCEPPVVPKFATMRGTRETYVYGRKVYFSCERGYVLQGSSVLQCVEDPVYGMFGSGGMWNGTEPTCQATICEDPGKPSNGSKDGSLYYFPHNVTYTCFAGYTLHGTVTISCGRDGTWSSEIPKCQACSAGTYKAGTNPHGSCTACPQHTNTVTEASTSPLQCVCSKGYKGPPGGPCTEITCPVLQAPEHGSMATCSNKLGDACEFTCESGYILNRGTSRRICEADGQWTGSDPGCSECPIDTFQADMRACLPCPRHSGSKGKVGNTKTGCVCDAGYAGPPGGPCKDINECNANSGKGPCQDLCHNTAGSYKCGCSVPGYIIDKHDPHTCIVDKTCKNLTIDDAPAYGGLVCHWYHEQNSQQCSVRCNPGYEFPTRTNNYETCGPTTGFLWTHEERGEIIEPCIEEFFPDFRLEANSVYFVRACNNLTEQEREQVKMDFAKQLSEEGVCIKREEKVCDMKNVGIICGRTRKRRKRDVVEEIDEVGFNFDISAVQIKDKLKDCQEICKFLKIPSARCSALCIPVYKRFLRAAVFYSKVQLTEIFGNNSTARFQSVKREFEPVDNSLKTSDVKTQCKPGMVDEEGICVPCGAGTYHDSQKNECVKCPRRKYQPSTMQSSCLTCPIGSTSIRLGSKSCMECPDGVWGEQCQERCKECVHGKCNKKTGKCDCTSGWEGLKCDRDIQSCAEDSCYPGVRCYDARAPAVGYRCGRCPSGMTGDGANCAV